MKGLARMAWGIFLFPCLTEGGGLKLFGQCPYRTNTFQKGASLAHDSSFRAIDAAMRTSNQIIYFLSPELKGKVDFTLNEVDCGLLDHHF